MPALALPISADRAIARARTAMLAGACVRVLITIAATAAIVMATVMHQDTAGTIVLTSTAVLWVMLSVRTAQNQQGLGRVAFLLEMRRFEEAEQLLADSLGSFSLFRAPVLAALHNLAALRHLQQRYDESRRLSTEILRYERRPQSLRSTRLLLAEAALELDDLVTAHATLTQLGNPNANTGLRETLKLTELQIDYCVRVGAWPQAMENLPWKIEMAELLPAESAGHVQALLALAAIKLQRPDWAAWLRRRVELLIDPNPLIERQPMLREVFVLP